MATLVHHLPLPCRPAGSLKGEPSPGLDRLPAHPVTGVHRRELAGDLNGCGFSFEWNEWNLPAAVDWANSFHPGSLQICVNLEGTGWLSGQESKVEFAPQTAGFVVVAGSQIRGHRAGGEQHQFLTVQFSAMFLRRRLAALKEQLHPALKRVLEGKSSGHSSTGPMTQRHRDLLNGVLAPPVFPGAQRLWFESKALEFAAEFFFCEPEVEPQESRARKLARERVSRAQEVLRKQLLNPPSLEVLGKLVGCSHFYLSRTFTRETGMTISQWLRQTRLERAAELLQSGKCNVTEAALEVGYSSLSHFSQTFHERFGCCPGLYPLRTPTQLECQPLLAETVAGQTKGGSR